MDVWLLLELKKLLPSPSADSGVSTWSDSHVFEPALPPHCQPENDFLLKLSSTFHTCVPTNLAFISTLLGTLSIISWLFAQLPQIYKNHTLKSTSGLSIFFLAEWLLGDVSNLLGCVFTDQALWQVVVASYYCMVDMVLVMQWLWYEQLQHGNPLTRVWSPERKCGLDNGGAPTNMQEVEGASLSNNSTAVGSSTSGSKDGTPSKTIERSQPRMTFHTPHFSRSPSPSGSSTPSTPSPPAIRRLARTNSPMPSPRTVLYISLLLAIAARASPITSTPTIALLPHSHDSAPLLKSSTQTAGRLLSWLSTLLYLGSRLPQLYKNHTRRSTSGLSGSLFAAAFFGNLFYSSSLLTNPCAWASFGPYGGGGWAGAEGSERAEWVGRAAPFWLGAAGVLVMDAGVGVQFWWFGEGGGEKVVVVEERMGRRWRWRRVSGWMRGWMPSVSEAGTPRPGSRAEGEASALLGQREGGGERAYGGV
ncbi:hypothetical protein H2201_004559 [Coniosporium apollinis]|uniref:PQ loop repeat protein n=1 Tax=Coniosporium apollinis TaxID=61459 RepID=A0ABQ9NU97_9PEZI|nr:hypothetical protein H2201_004559 [Coniosporium apollinis]